MKCQILLLLAIIIGLCEATSIFTFLRQNGLTNEPKIDNKELFLHFRKKNDSQNYAFWNVPYFR